MSGIFPILIPSKGRPNACRTVEHLVADGVPCTVVVEPQDWDAYSDALTGMPGVGMVALPENDRGIAYVRNWIHDEELRRGTGWYWMLDDDVTGFFRTSQSRNVRCTASEALVGAQAIFDQPTAAAVGQAALEYQQLAWSSTRAFTTTGYCDVVVAIHAGRTKGIRYREQVVLKEDRDFTLQVLAAGMETCRVQRYSFAAPKNGSNEGGLKELYDTAGREERAVKAMVEAWGTEICTPHVKADGRRDVRINWGWFKKRRSQGRA